MMKYGYPLTAKHLYQMTVYRAGQKLLPWIQIGVHANDRADAARIATSNGFVVCDCSMIA